LGLRTAGLKSCWLKDGWSERRFDAGRLWMEERVELRAQPEPQPEDRQQPDLL
jgi:hypothetical protein